MTIPEKIVSPFTPTQVEALNQYQASPGVHPYTCGNNHDSEMILIATQDGWVCPDENCDYTQHWAHGFTAVSEDKSERLMRSVGLGLAAAGAAAIICMIFVVFWNNVNWLAAGIVSAIVIVGSGSLVFGLSLAGLSYDEIKDEIGDFLG